MQVQLNTLPTELLFFIFSKLTLKEIVGLRLVDQKLKVIATGFLLCQDNKEKLELFSKYNFQQMHSHQNNQKFSFEDIAKNLKTIYKVIQLNGLMCTVSPEVLSITDMVKMQMIIDEEQGKIEQVIYSNSDR